MALLRECRGGLSFKRWRERLSGHPPGVHRIDPVGTKGIGLWLYDDPSRNDLTLEQTIYTIWEATKGTVTTPDWYRTPKGIMRRLEAYTANGVAGHWYLDRDQKFRCFADELCKPSLKPPMWYRRQMEWEMKRG